MFQTAAAAAAAGADREAPLVTLAARQRSLPPQGFSPNALPEDFIFADSEGIEEILVGRLGVLRMSQEDFLKQHVFTA